MTGPSRRSSVSGAADPSGAGPERDEAHAEDADDRGAGRQVEPRGGDDSEHAHGRAEAPADEQSRRDRPTDEGGGERLDDEIREDEQHAADADRAGHDDAERSIEDEVPEAHAPALGVRPAGVGGDQEERTAAEPVKRADQPVEDRDLEDLVAVDGQERADEHRPDVLDAVGGAVGQQDGAGRGRGIDDADHRLLRHAPLAAAREREDQRATAAIWASAMSTKTTSRASTWTPR